MVPDAFYKMSLVLALPHSSAALVQRGLGGSVTTERTLELALIERLLDRGTARLVVVDPDEVPAEFYAALAATVARVAGVLVVWTAFRPRAVTYLIAAAQVCAVEVVFREIGESRARWGARIARLRADSLGRELLRRVAPGLSALPAQLALDVVGLLNGHLDAGNVAELTMLTGGTRRALERQLRRTGFAGAAHIVLVARLLRARESLLGLEVSIELAAGAAGFASSRALGAACRRYVHCTPTELASALHADRVLERLVSALVRAPGSVPGTGAG